MEYHEIRSDDIDELFSWGSGWDRRYTQLTRGPLRFCTRQVRLPEVLIEWNSYGQSVLFEEVMHSPVFFFGVLLESSGSGVYRGKELAIGDALIYHPGQEQDYRLRPSSIGLGVSISFELWNALGWRLSNRRTATIVPQRLKTLVGVCEDATALAVMAKNGNVAPQIELSLRDRIVVALCAVLQPWGEDASKDGEPLPDESGAFTLAKHAVQILESRDAGDKLSIADLASELGVSQRVIFDAFARCYGVGPYEFHQIRKLHRFRKAILEGSPDHGKISQAAALAGFHHMGRFSQLYRRQFGETPRQTMRRRDAGS